jgi:hypothetical protein
MQNPTTTSLEALLLKMKSYSSTSNHFIDLQKNLASFTAKKPEPAKTGYSPVRNLNLTRSVSFPSMLTKEASQVRRNPSDFEKALLRMVTLSKPQPKVVEEKPSRCINYDKNTEIFNIV